MTPEQQKARELVEKKELLEKLHKLTDKGFLKYLIKTGWCMRDAWDLYIEEWTDEDIQNELMFLKENDFGNP